MGERQRTALRAAVRGAAIQVAVVVVGRLVIDQHPSTFRCPPPLGPGEDPMAHGLGCLATSGARSLVMLSTYALGLLAVIATIEVALRRVERSPHQMLLAMAVAAFSGIGMLALYLPIQAMAAGPVVLGSWVAATLTVPAALIALTYSTGDRAVGPPPAPYSW
jgi:hypothetical protein